MKAKNKIMKFILAITIVLGTAVSVNAQDVKTEKRDVPTFTGVDIGGVFDVTLKQGENQLVEIEASEKILQLIKTEVKGDILKITFDKKGPKKVDDIEVVIVAKEINSIKASGATDIDSEGALNADNFSLEVSGASDVNLTLKVNKLETNIAGAADLELVGEAKDHIIMVSGAANLDAKEFKTENTNIEVSGASNAIIYASEEVNGNISGMGNIKLAGKPKVSNISTSGLAEVTTSDTTEIKIGKKNFIIVDDGQIDEDVNDWKDKKREEKKKKFKGHWGGFELNTSWYVDKDFNFDAPANNDYLELNMSKSIGANLNLWEKNFKLVKNNLGLVTGLGFKFNNYRFDNPRTLLGNDRDTVYGFIDTNYSNPNNFYSAKKSKLNTSYFTVPLFLEYQTQAGKRKFFVGAGAIGGIKIGSHTKIVYEKDNNKTKNKDKKSFHTNPFYYGVRGYIGWGGIHLFADYALSTMFEDGEGPELYPFSIGLSIVRF